MRFKKQNLPKSKMPKDLNCQLQRLKSNIIFISIDKNFRFAKRIQIDVITEEGI